MKPPRIHDFFTLLREGCFENDSDEDDDDGYDYNEDDADDDDDDAVKGDVADNARWLKEALQGGEREPLSLFQESGLWGIHSWHQEGAAHPPTHLAT